MKLALATVAALTLATSAQSQQMQCGPVDQVYGLLAGERFEEMRIGAGLSGPGIVEVWVNTETGTFTIVGTLPDGIACIIATGGSFEFEERNYIARPNL
jgi:hypothetical protein